MKTELQQLDDPKRLYGQVDFLQTDHISLNVYYFII